MDDAQPLRTVSASDVFLAFLRQGLTGFGGPAAHLAYFRREFVARRGWLSEAAYADVLAMCHVLPGPTATQIAMAIGLRQAGLGGALAALAGFALPAAVALIGLAFALPHVGAQIGDGWLYGLKIAVAAVVLQAVAGMAGRLAVGPVRAGMAIGAALGLVVAQSPAAQIVALAAGGLFGAFMLREPDREIPPDDPARGVDTGSALIALGLFVLLLIGLPVLANLLANPGVGLASVFYRTGALAFADSHLVLPLLEREVVDRRWIAHETFLAGYGLVQVLPGPLFNVAGFVGAAQRYGPTGIPGGLIALFSVYLPGLLLVVGVLPFWDRLKRDAWAQAAAAGIGATAVGMLAAVLWDPVLMAAVKRPADWALVAAAFVFLQIARFPPWLVVVGFAAATQFLI